MDKTEQTAGFKSWLAQKRQKIMGREAEALKLLDRNDCPGYQKCMREKAELLAVLYEEAMRSGMLSSLPESARKEAQDSLDRFSSGAQTALHLNSTFYMSALLYPDDHKPGEPDNLQKLIDSLP